MARRGEKGGGAPMCHSGEGRPAGGGSGSSFPMRQRPNAREPVPLLAERGAEDDEGADR